MDKDQEAAWLEAQKVVVSEDLVAAAKQQLAFLAAVDRRRWLYDGPLLDRAIYRYKVFWLPLLAKHCEHGAEDDFLCVPLDCEWIWHCHRLNPVQYKKDCEEIFGRILDSHNVISSLQERSKHKMTEKWSELYPEEPFEFSCDFPVVKETSSEHHGVASRLTYDLVSAVKRQSSFCYQVSRPCMHDRRFLEGAVARYKGFLNLIKINHDRSTKQFTVPTYDIDLMWHSHQLYPLSYCNDMINLLGKVLEHDDMDSDRSKGKKLDVGFEKTTKQWEDTFGSRYWKAGAMYRGNSPSPVTSIPCFSSHPVVNETIIDKPLKQSMVVQVLLEIVQIKNLPNSEKSNLYVLFAKKKPDLFFYGGALSIQSVSGKKHRASFTCEPTGELTLTLMSRFKPKIATLARAIGTTSISLEDLNNPSSELSTEKWFELNPHSGNVDSKPICLRVAVSFTVPVLAPFELRMFKSLPVSTNTCLLPLRGKEKFKGWTRFLDHNGEEVIRLQIRNLEKMEGKNVTSLTKEVVGIPRESRNPWQLAKYADNTWSLNNYNISLVENKTGLDGHIFEIRGDFMMKLFPGEKLDYEPKCWRKEKNSNANEFITLVEFSAENPYGKAVALFDTKAGLIEVNETKFVLLGVLLAFILKYANKMQRNNVVPSKEDAEVIPSSNEAEHVERKTANGIACAEYLGKVVDSVSDNEDKLDALSGPNSGGCGSGCSGGCGGGGCGKMSGGCGGCGGGCGNMSARCGGGCGGCGSMATGIMPSAGCGGKCGGGGCGGCGNMVDGNGDAVGDGYGGGDFSQYGADHVIPNHDHAEGYAGTLVTV